MSNTLDRTHFTGAILPIVKQSGVKRLCAEMVKSGIIPDIQTVGYQNGISGFIYNSEITEIYKTHEFAIDYLVNEYADSLNENAFSVLSSVAENLNMTSSCQTDIVKTILAVDYLGQLMYENGTVRTNLTDTQGYEIEIGSIEGCNFTTMRQNDDFDLIDSMLTKQTGGEYEFSVDNEHQLQVYEITELRENATHREKYTVDFYVELAGEHIVVI